jgi:Flp pilus assembly protein TadG
VNGRPVHRPDGAPRRRRPEDGSAAIEAVILFPVVLLLVMAIIQAAVYYHARNVAQSAANGGAVVGAFQDGTADTAAAEARARIERAGGRSLLEGSEVVATRTGTQVTVTVEGHAITFVPGLPDLTVRQSVSAPVERFVAP